MSRRKPKRMYTYTMQRYLPLLGMTLFISWFVVLMQMLWLYTDELVGKGLDLWVLGKLIFNAALMVLPTAVPLGILLASLMTFGSLGERLELLAMKSAGVPLYRIMAPLFGIVVAISLGLFVYLNTMVMDAQVRFYQIIFSARDSRPDLDIPEGTFYNGIRGYNIFVKQKDSRSQSLLGVMIYDHSASRSPRVIMADSGLLIMDPSKKFLTLDLYKGESFEALGDKSFVGNTHSKKDSIPQSYLKEKFDNKQIVIFLDLNFSMVNADGLKSQFVGKNVFQLDRYIKDTAMIALDSVGRENANTILSKSIEDRYAYRMPLPNDTALQSVEVWQSVENAAKKHHLNIDSLFAEVERKDKQIVLETILEEIGQHIESVRYQGELYEKSDYFYRTHAQEWHRKFTFPVACIIFFFIGAPLGAIIGKGGIGMPVVATVLFFVLYYMLDTFGYNLSYNGTWEPWFGMWFSTMCLSPFGVFLTYKASRDSASLNIDAITLRIKQIFKPEKIRNVSYRDIILNPIKPETALEMVCDLQMLLQSLEKNAYWRGGRFSYISINKLNSLYLEINKELEETITKLQDSENALLLAKLVDIPFWATSFNRIVPQKKSLYWLFVAFLPLSLSCVIYSSNYRRKQKKQLDQTLLVLDELEKIIQRELEDKR